MDRSRVTLGPDGSVELTLRLEPRAIVGAGGAIGLRADDAFVRDFLLLVMHEAGGVDLDVALGWCGYSSRATYYAKRKRYRAGGLAALSASPPGPRNKWRRSDEVIRRVVAMRTQAPERSAAQIAKALRGAGFDVSVRSVERTLSEYGLCRPRAHSAER